MNDEQFKNEMRALGINPDEANVVNLGNDMEEDLVVDNTSKSVKNVAKNGIAAIIAAAIVLFIAIISISFSVSYKMTLIDVQGTSFNVGPIHFVPNEYSINVKDLKPGVQIIYAENRGNAFFGPFLKTYKTATVVREKNTVSLWVNSGSSKDNKIVNKQDIIYIINSIDTQKAQSAEETK